MNKGALIALFIAWGAIAFFAGKSQSTSTTDGKNTTGSVTPETAADWRRSLQDAIDLRPDHVSAYALVVDRLGEGDEASLKFEVNARGSSKMVEIAKCAKFVRRIKRDPALGEAGLSGGEADHLFNMMRVAERQQGRR